MNLNTGTPGVPAAAATIAGALVLWLEDVVRYLLDIVALPEQIAGSSESLLLLAAAGAVGWLAQRWTWANSTVQRRAAAAAANIDAADQRAREAEQAALVAQARLEQADG